MTLAPLPAERFLEEAERLVAAAESRGFPLRICGSVGIYYAVRQDPVAVSLYALRDGTDPPHVAFKDLDLAGREKNAAAVYHLFVRDLGFREDRETNALFGSFRNIFYHPQFLIDVFYDTLRFNHAIPIKNRLFPGVALSPEDLFLGKIQIHAPLRKDLVDVGAFVATVPLDRLDRSYLTSFFADDWGLWYDAHLNLAEAHRLFANLPGTVPPDQRGLVLLRLQEYQRFLADVPKTRRWEKRQAKGTKEAWYEPVDEVR